MNFTREPVVETIITPKEGYKLVIRNSKVGSQEEFFVEAVEVVSFGSHCFYRCLEKPKAFLVPVTDYEVLEVRETRMVLKTPAIEKVKIGGGQAPKKESAVESEATAVEPKRRDKRRRKRRSRSEKEEEERPEEESRFPGGEEARSEPRSLIPPPSTLISETITRYKDSTSFKEPPEEGSQEVEEIFPEFLPEESETPSSEAEEAADATSSEIRPD